MRLVFLGSPEFALPSLEALRGAGHEIGLVVTQPDRPAGRGLRVASSPVATYAREHDLPVWQTRSLRGGQAEERLRAVGAEAMVLAAFAALVPDNVLALTPGGISNVHPSLLPRWRGAAPIQAALLAGDRETGVSIIRLVSALDAGPVYAQERVPIDAGDDFLTLEPRLAKLGARLLVRVLEERPEPWPQDDSQATFCRRIERDDARIDWTQPAEVIWRQVRAYRGWPQAFTHTDRRLLKILGATPLGGDRAVGPDACDGPTPPGDNRSAWHAAWRSLEPGTLKLLEDGTPAVATGAGALRLDEVQLEGKRAMSGADFARGYPRLSGAKLA